jgi:hypothetical protein
MAIYSLAVRSAGNNNPQVEIVAGTDRAKLLELGATVATLGSGPGTATLGRSVVKGTASTTGTVQAENDADPAGTVALVSSWNLIPQVSNVWMRQLTFSWAKGAGFVWTFSQGLIIGASSSLVLWAAGNLSGTNFDVWAIVDE